MSALEALVKRIKYWTARQQWGCQYVCWHRLHVTMQEAILRMKRADWMRPLLELLEGQARRAGQAGLSSGQKALAAHLFEIIINEVS